MSRSTIIYIYIYIYIYCNLDNKSGIARKLELIYIKK